VTIISWWICSSTILWKQDWKVRSSSIALQLSSNYYNPSGWTIVPTDKPGAELIPILTECSRRIYLFYLHRAKETIRWRPNILWSQLPAALSFYCCIQALSSCYDTTGHNYYDDSSTFLSPWRICNKIQHILSKDVTC
jgi:hypothetical protein